MEDTLSRIDRLQESMSAQEQSFQMEADANIRTAREYVGDIEPPTEDEFMEKLNEARENGMSDRTAEAVQDSWNRAGECLRPETSDIVRSEMFNNLDKANEWADGGKYPGSFDDVALKNESLFRSGIKEDLGEDMRDIANGDLENLPNGLRETWQKMPDRMKEGISMDDIEKFRESTQNLSELVEGYDGKEQLRQVNETMHNHTGKLHERSDGITGKPMDGQEMSPFDSVRESVQNVSDRINDTMQNVGDRIYEGVQEKKSAIGQNSKADVSIGSDPTKLFEQSIQQNGKLFQNKLLDQQDRDSDSFSTKEGALDKIKESLENLKNKFAKSDKNELDINIGEGNKLSFTKQTNEKTGLNEIVANFNGKEVNMSQAADKWLAFACPALWFEKQKNKLVAQGVKKMISKISKTGESLTKEQTVTKDTGIAR